jgi:hypothetical protein
MIGLLTADSKSIFQIYIPNFQRALQAGRLQRKMALAGPRGPASAIFLCKQGEAPRVVQERGKLRSFVADVKKLDRIETEWVP